MFGDCASEPTTSARRHAERSAGVYYQARESGGAQGNSGALQQGRPSGEWKVGREADRGDGFERRSGNDDGSGEPGGAAIEPFTAAHGAARFRAAAWECAPASRRSPEVYSERRRGESRPVGQPFFQQPAGTPQDEARSAGRRATSRGMAEHAGGSARPRS